MTVNTHLKFEFDKHTLNRLLAIGALVGFGIATWFNMNMGGDDLYDCYRLFMYGDYKCVFVPPHSRTMLLPLLLPWPWAWLVWSFLNGALLIILFKKMGQDLLPALFSFPWIMQWWLGQIDIIPTLGVITLLFNQAYPYKFLGAWMALVKPHILAVPVLVYANERRKNLIVVGIVLLITLIFFGVWPIEWFLRLLKIPVDLWRIVSFYIAPVGIGLIIKFRKNIYIILAATMLLPPSSIYTFFYLWALPGVNGWLMTLLSWVWILLFPLFGKNVVAINAFLPLIAIYFIYRQTEIKPSPDNIPSEDSNYARIESGMQK